MIRGTASQCARTGVMAVLVAALLGVTQGAAVAGPASDPDVVAASVAPDNDRACTTSRVPVRVEPATPLTPGDDLGLPLGDVAAPLVPDPTVLVKLCLPRGDDDEVVVPATVQVLVHGITYDHRYWNIADPEDPDGNRYSWEHAAATAGYATLAIDRIGNGQSTHPVSSLVDISTNAAVVRQLVTALREGTIEAPIDGAVVFDRVVLVGHSYGSMTSWFAASGSDEVDGLVVTGATHDVREVDAPVSIETGHYPALLDPQFEGAALDPGYVTSLPGQRYELFYAPGTDVHPTIVERDEATKGTVSQFELVNYPVIFRTQLDVRVPVFHLIGTLDGIFCSQEPLDLAADCSSAESVVANERPWLGPDVPSVEAYVVEEAGHDLNAFRSSQEAFGAAMDWMARHVPARTDAAPDAPGDDTGADGGTPPGAPAPLPAPGGAPLPSTGGGAAALAVASLAVVAAGRRRR